MEDCSNTKEARALILTSTTPFQQKVPGSLRVAGVSISPRSLSNMQVVSYAADVLSERSGEQ